VVTVTLTTKAGLKVKIKLTEAQARKMESEVGDPRVIFDLMSEGKHYEIHADTVRSMVIEAPGSHTNIVSGNARVGMQVGNVTFK